MSKPLPKGCHYPMCDRCERPDCDVEVEQYIDHKTYSPVKQVTYKGKVYKNMSVACRELNVPYMKVWLRKKRHPDLTFQLAVDSVVTEHRLKAPERAEMTLCKANETIYDWLSKCEKNSEKYNILLDVINLLKGEQECAIEKL